MIRGQSETIGLMVIVIVLVLIALIAVRFMLVGHVNDNYDSYLSVKANNMANSIKKGNLCGSNFEQGIVACCNGNNFCNVEACSLVSKELSKIINHSDEKVLIEAMDQKLKTCFIVGSCEKGISANKYLLGNGVNLNLRICRK